MAVFADKFERTLAEEGVSLRGLARRLAKDEKDNAEVETIRRRLYKYRPRPGGGAAAVKPTDPTRWEIEAALGVDRDSLADDPESFQPTVADLVNTLVARIAEKVEDDLLAKLASSGRWAA